MNNLQIYVCKKFGIEPDSYATYASQIENEFITKNLAILIELGILESAIKKLVNYISSKLDEDLVLQYIKNKNLLNNSKLPSYEKKLLKNIK